MLPLMMWLSSSLKGACELKIEGTLPEGCTQIRDFSSYGDDTPGTFLANRHGLFYSRMQQIGRLMEQICANPSCGPILCL